MNEIKEKTLLLLLAGLAFGYSITPNKQWMVLKTASREWNKISKEKLRKEVNSLYRFEFITKKENKDGSVTVLLTEKGELKALNQQLKDLKNNKQKWDKKWRMVAFDIPEKDRRGRNALRHKLKNIGFCELQKSIFIFPYDCQKEIALLVKIFDLKKYVRFAVLEMIDNESYFKSIFNL